MRDHPAHRAPVMGGAWGARLDQGQISAELWLRSWQQMMKDPLSRANRSSKGPIQSKKVCWKICVLKLLIPPPPNAVLLFFFTLNGSLRVRTKNFSQSGSGLGADYWAWNMPVISINTSCNSLLIILFSCDIHQNSIGFPTERKNQPHNFVGASVAGPRLWNICPEKCRRKGHLHDWEHC